MMLSCARQCSLKCSSMSSFTRKQLCLNGSSCRNSVNTQSTDGNSDGKIHARRYTRHLKSGIIVMIPIASLVTWYFYKTCSRQKLSTNENELHHNPQCSGKSGTLIKRGHFWLPFEFFKGGQVMENLRNFSVRDGDVLVASFPKSGTTWLQEIVYLILHGPNADHDTTIEERFPYLEYVYPGLKSLSKLVGPRYLKTHLPFELLPADAQNGVGKIIYIARNAKDVSVSYFHFIRMLTVTKYGGTFIDFFDMFVQGKVGYGPWHDHVLQYWQKKDSSNLLFLTYEDLHQNPVVVIKKISEFLGRPINDQQALKIAHKCSFKQMKSNPMVNYSWWDNLGIRDTAQTTFMRKGTVGDWTGHYSADMVEQVETLCINPTRQHGLNIRDR